MVKVSVEVRNGAALFEVAIRAQSIDRAASVVRGSYRLRHQGEVPDRSRRLLRVGARTPDGESRGRAAGVHSGLRQVGKPTCREGPGTLCLTAGPSPLRSTSCCLDRTLLPSRTSLHAPPAPGSGRAEPPSLRRSP